MKKNNNSKFLLLIILVLAFILRIFNLQFPYFTSEEAQIAVRGYSLATEGKDELGRFYPLLFNSLLDYKLPTTSYLAAIGIKLFGKSDFGARIPFVVIGVAIVFLAFIISKVFNQKKEFGIFVGILAALSPPLIFLSRVPNETILLIFSFLLLFYFLTKEKITLIWVNLIIILSLTTSKAAWWIITPYVLCILLVFQKEIEKKQKIKILLVSILLTFLVVIFFIFVPQAKRSLLENNFSILSDISIQNGINKLRGQGVAAGWPPTLERILFNKSEFLTLGFLNWMSNLNPSSYFGQFDESGKFNFTQVGVFPKVLIIPFIFGLIYILNRRKERTLILFISISAFPSFFLISGLNHQSQLLIIPWVIFILAFGFLTFNKKVIMLIFLSAILELLIVFNSVSLDLKITNKSRPIWITELTKDIYSISKNEKIAVSDDIVEDLIQFIEYYEQINVKEGYIDVPYPYKFRQTKLGNINLVGADNQFYNCGDTDKPIYVIASQRDFKEIQQHLNIKDTNAVEKIYFDSLGNQVADLIGPIICIKEI